jgi:hypothetical protein
MIEIECQLRDIDLVSTSFIEGSTAGVDAIRILRSHGQIWLARNVGQLANDDMHLRRTIAKLMISHVEHVLGRRDPSAKL